MTNFDLLCSILEDIHRISLTDSCDVRASISSLRVFVLKLVLFSDTDFLFSDIRSLADKPTHSVSLGAKREGRRNNA